jgi:hypothetical protein
MAGIVCIPYLNAEDRDPFVSIIDLKKKQFGERKARIELSQVKLKGIIWNEFKPIAVINDDLVMIGEDWQGYEVTGIDKSTVTLNDGVKSYKLFIEEGAQPEEEERKQEKPPGLIPPPFEQPDMGFLKGEPKGE